MKTWATMLALDMQVNVIWESFLEQNQLHLLID